MASDNSRRHFFKTTLGITSTFLASKVALADGCILTPPQTEGPFYPVSKITDDSINDLTFLEGHPKRAKGEVIYITGTVMDKNCNPVKGALVEIWQAAASGRYNHPSDTSALVPDPHFQTWGEFVTGADGKYVFQTILPGHYPADETWTRPPHVHYKVTRRGFKEMITQMYFSPSSFEGEKVAFIQKLNEDDLILQAVKNPESVTINFNKIKAPLALGPLLAYDEGKLEPVGMLTAKAGEKVGNFDLVLNGLR